MIRAAVLAAVVVAGAGAQTRDGVVTLVETATPITAIAQDGRRIAWTTRRGGCDALVILDLRLNAQIPLSSPRGPTCRAGFAEYPAQTLAIGGIRAIWSLDTPGTATVATAAPDTAGDMVVSRRVGAKLVAMAGDGTPLVYGWLRGGTGGIDFVDGRRIVPMRNAPVPDLLALNGGRVAVVARGRPRAVQVRLFDGTLERTVRLGGIVLDIALSPTLLAVLYDVPGARRVDAYALATGRRLARHSVFRSALDLSLSDDRLVFRAGRSIRLLRLGRQGGARTIAATGEIAFGLSIEADRVIWADDPIANGRGRWLIRAVFLD